MKTLQVACIVCGNYITWDESPLPAACSTHTYQEVFEAYDQNAAQQGVQADGACTCAKNPIIKLVNGVCPVCNGTPRR